MAIRTVSGIVYTDKDKKDEVNSVEIKSGKYASSIVYAEIPSERLVPYNQITAGKATIEKVILSFKSADAQTSLYNSGGNAQYATYAKANADCQYILTKANSLQRINNGDTTDTGKALNKISEDWNNKNYYLAFMLKASDTKGHTISNISYTIYYNFKTTAVKPPSSVKIASEDQITVAQDNVTLSFNAGSNGEDNDLSGYQIQYRVSDNSAFAQQQWSELIQLPYTSETSSVSVSVQPKGSRGQYTQYRVRSLGRTDLQDEYNSEYIVAEGLVRYNTLPSSPVVSDPNSEVFESTIEFSWSKSQDVTDSVQGYHLYRWSGTDSENLVKSSSAVTVLQDSELRYNISESQRGTYVKYEIKAFDSFGVQSENGSFTSLHKKNTAPYHSSTDRITPSTTLYISTPVNLTWDKARSYEDNDIAGYILQSRSTTKDSAVGDWVYIADITDGLSYQPSVDYSKLTSIDFRVTAYDTFGVSDTPYDSATVYIYEYPVAGDSFTAIPVNHSEDDPTVYESGQITLKWNKATAKYTQITTYRYSTAVKKDDGTYGAQTTPKTITPTKSGSYLTYKISINASRGKTTRIRLYAYDKLENSAQYSPCYLIGNVLPSSAALKYPKSAVHNYKPILVFELSAHPTKVKRKLYVTLGDYTTSIEGITPDSQLISLIPEVGVNGIIKATVVDDLGATSAEITKSVSISSAEWTRSIQENSIIANATISHQSELTQMMSQLNASRVAYGLGEMTFSDQIGYFKNWMPNMEQMYNGVKQIYEKFGIEFSNKFPSYDTNYPKASIINFVRDIIEGV